MKTSLHNSWKLCVSALLIPLATAYSLSSASADTITLVSGGGGAVGSADPITQVSTNRGATYQAAIIIPPVHIGTAYYDTIPGTEWISFNSTGYGLRYTDMFFRVTFQLPVGFSNPQLSLSVFADNVATGILNGVQIGGQPFVETTQNFENPPGIFIATDPTLFQVGQNVLTIWLYNFNDPSGLDYQATVTFIPEPSTALQVGASLLGAVFLRRKRRTQRITF